MRPDRLTEADPRLKGVGRKDKVAPEPAHREKATDPPTFRWNNCTGSPVRKGITSPCFPYDEAEQSHHLHFKSPRHGGHVGFIAFNNQGEYWSETRAVTFLDSIS